MEEQVNRQETFKEKVLNHVEIPYFKNMEDLGLYPDEKGNPICYDMKSTYEWCEQYRFTSDNYTFNKELKK